MTQKLRVAGVQMAPIWGNKAATLAKVMEKLAESAQSGADLVAFSEGLVPGYPFWLSDTHASKFDDQIQKEIHAHYIDQAVDIDAGDLDGLCSQCADTQTACYLGVIERAGDRAGHSLYCTLVYISKDGEIVSAHRKLMPTYEERLSWAIGDGHGLRVHDLGDFKVGGLNCWENWMPLARASMYAQGESLHIAVWPGGLHNTESLTPVIAKEGRLYAMSTSGVMRPSDYPDDLPHRDYIVANAKPVMANGGSCIAGPDGKWLVAPVGDQEQIIYADIDPAAVREERQNFDPSGHYSRPDIFQLSVNRKRQKLVEFTDD